MENEDESKTDIQVARYSQNYLDVINSATI